jgi:hypothetical protein
VTFVKADRVQEVSTSTGTGALELAGAYNASFKTFGDVMTNGETCQVFAINEDVNNEWEVFEATYVSSTNSLTRSAFISSSTDSPIIFSSGDKRVAMVPPASKMLVEDNDGNSEVANDFAVGGNLTVDGTITSGTATLMVAVDSIADMLALPLAYPIVSVKQYYGRRRRRGWRSVPVRSGRHDRYRRWLLLRCPRRQVFQDQQRHALHR